MKHFFSLLFICICSIQVFAKGEGVISGRVIDSVTKEPLPYATVTVNSEEQLVTGTVTNVDGRFTIDGVNEGNYTVSCSFVGYNSKEIPLLIGRLNTIFDLGRITLEPSSENIDEVIVSAKKEIVSSGLDKKSFDVAKNVSQSGGSVLDAMRNLPGVTIDQESKVLLRGSDKVSVLIDGKQSSLTGFGNQKGLDNIPASSIEKIEIINNPSAKYDARGMAGIINIIYKKEKETGFNGEAGFNFGLGELSQRKSNLPNIMDKYSFTPKYNPSISLNYRTEKANLFLQSDGIVRSKVNSNEFSTRKYSDGTPDVISQFLENRTQQEYNIKVGFDWFMNDKNTLTLFALFEDEYHIDRGHVPYDYLTNGKRKRFWTWAEDENTRFINYAANFKHKFAEPGHEIEAGYLYTKGGEDELFPFTDSSAVRNSTDETHLKVDEIVSNWNVDYVKPLRSGRVELGTKVQLRRIPISYKINPGENSILDPNLGDWSEYNENIYALYCNYVFESKKVDIEGGMRLENTGVKYDIDPENIYYTTNDDYNYLSLFPNVRVTYKINVGNKLSAFVNRRVDRPGEFELRPFPKYDDPEILKTGNPYLRPQFTNTFELAYKTNWTNGSVYLSGFYRTITDIFSRIYTNGNTTGETIINTIPQNLGKGSNLGFELAFDHKITSFWNMNGSFLWYANQINAFSGTSIYPQPQPFHFEENKSNTWNLKLNNNLELPWNTEMQATAIYYAPDIIPQGKTEDRFSFDVGLKKILMNGKAELMLSAVDLFNTFGISQVIEGENFTLNTENYYETQVITLGIKYKF
ncbi:Outer membrane receptor proteins, mostly Fe transport [Mariniphaga anaerophila]|uniref:Outer membrane receptor proteins, mostly Fe transport n=1 Tax=Mariniphaga anaerophila TaxID=1484053 RepID=A0A1M4WNI5_9BACT|nr:TonB-dependent receptor [Mariniphaga anaerophila]SHE82774.1 Outer membrane receptor proteins, mostly Fe transport [Mariniphaga anaerophila]